MFLSWNTSTLNGVNYNVHLSCRHDGYHKLYGHNESPFSQKMPLHAYKLIKFLPIALPGLWTGHAGVSRKSPEDSSRGNTEYNKLISALHLASSYSIMET